MTGEPLQTWADSRSAAILRSLARHRLVFVQLGAAFEPVRALILAQLGICVTVDSRHEWIERAGDSNTLVVADLEACRDSAGDVLGEVRAIVLSALDLGKCVCLVSRAPRISYGAVPGSSVLEDAALITVPLLTKPELQLAQPADAPRGWQWPRVASGETFDTNTLGSILSELGQGVVAALDHALFELDPKTQTGLRYLAPREIEALRGAGLVRVDAGGSPELAITNSQRLLREALAAEISATVTPAAILPEVSAGLWFIERRIRNAVRTAAISQFGDDWRGSSVGGMKDEVLRRAQLDTSVAAKLVGELRDPLEWLTLSELLDVVESEKFGGLGVDRVIWRKMREQLVPIRNRLAHVRILKSEDAEVVSMWASVSRSRLG